MTLADFYNITQRNRASLQDGGVTVMTEVVGKRAIEIVNIQKVQLRKGKAADGGYLPRYRDDPFFKTMAQAIAYESWKAQWSHPEKPREVMDFFINGYYYSSLQLSIRGHEFVIDSNASFAASVEGKANGIGLNMESKMLFMKNYGREDVILILSDITGIPRR